MTGDLQKAPEQLLVGGKEGVKKKKNLRGLFDAGLVHSILQIPHRERSGASGGGVLNSHFGSM